MLYLRNDAIEEIENNNKIVPNYLYDSNHTLIATFNSISDVNSFCNTYNHNNGYNGLQLGQKIRINHRISNESTRPDLTQDWEIVGFDTENNTVATDGTIKSNGYGILLNPVFSSYSNYSIWASSNNIATPYISSIIHTQEFPTLAESLKEILGDHLINRNVLLGSSIDTSVDGGGTNACIWTTAYCTLPSLYQITGAYYYRRNLKQDSVYNVNIKMNLNDIGEANYKIPLYAFRYYIRSPGASSWIRTPQYNSTGCIAYVISTNIEDRYETDMYHILQSNLTGSTYGYHTRPLIYIR